MPTSAERITQLELELAEARAIYERENGIRFLIIMREISPEEKQRIMDSLTDRKERILFGLEAPERTRASRQKRRGSEMPDLPQERADPARAALAHGAHTQG